MGTRRPLELPSLMHQAALLASPAERAALTAVYELRAALKGAARGVHEEAIEARLNWWQRELTLLPQGQAHHPATRALLAAHPVRAIDVPGWLDVLAVHRRTSTPTTTLFEAQAERDWGHLLQLSSVIMGAAPPKDWLAQLARALQWAEVLREAGADAAGGHVRLPLDQLAQAGASLQALKAGQCDSRCSAWFAARAQETRRALHALAHTCPPPARHALLPLRTFAALMHHVLKPIARQGALPLREVPTLKPVRAWIIAIHCSFMR
ncbi:MAG TPA: squalene/phytoene synthase family protein [Acidiferrobacteraceae bacterium]|nr:squalene/phytoene synthase family protein [Acidiferrobacteraceae bacterium]